ncbi:MAG: ribulose-phosphate 3-epimerase [Saprospiraceae bacterium]|nr:ribulose-phosphate 3-epimerase [Saprospiraceae bacterium]
MSNQPIISPSILNTDFSLLGQTIDLLNQSEADWIHLDIMDGRFVPNISFGIPVVKSIKRRTAKPLDVHLMIEHPELHLEAFREAGADILTVHYETCPHLHRTIEQIHLLGAKAGVAINPHTPVEVLKDILEHLELILIMSVNPGFGGQQFIYQSIPKVRRLKTMLMEENVSPIIEIDGGIGLQNAEAVIKAGVDALVAGNAIFSDKDPGAVISRLKDISKSTTYV